MYLQAATCFCSKSIKNVCSAKAVNKRLSADDSRVILVQTHFIKGPCSPTLRITAALMKFHSGY